MVATATQTVQRQISGDAFTTRPVVMGRRGVISSGHYLASARIQAADSAWIIPAA